MYAFVGKKKMGENLIKLRGSQQQNAVAKAINITPTALSNYESGARIPRDEVKARIANYYGVTLESIFFLQ